MTISLDQRESLEDFIRRKVTWQDYERLRDYLSGDSSIEQFQLFFYENLIWVENMGSERVLHSKIRQLLSLILIWFNEQLTTQLLTAEENKG
jgi:hypothetical protein